MLMADGFIIHLKANLKCFMASLFTNLKTVWLLENLKTKLFFLFLCMCCSFYRYRLGGDSEVVQIILINRYPHARPIWNVHIGAI